MAIIQAATEIEQFLVPNDVWQPNNMAIWLACAFDAEGHISLHKNKYYKGQVYSPAMVITNTKAPFTFFANALAERLGIHNENVFTKRNGQNPRTKDIYVLAYHKRTDCIELCNLLEPFLVIKKQQCQLLREACNISIAEGCTAPNIRLEEIYQKLKILNHRGREP